MLKTFNFIHTLSILRSEVHHINQDFNRHLKDSNIFPNGPSKLCPRISGMSVTP